MTRAIVLAFALLLPMSAFAAEQAPAGKAPVATTPANTGSAGAATCADGDELAKQRIEREARLAELGRRLAAEAQEEGDFRVLNRTGHNYDQLPVAADAPAKPAAPADTKSR